MKKLSFQDGINRLSQYHFRMTYKAFECCKYRLIGQYLLTKWWEKLSLVKVLFNSRRTSIWITSVFSIFVEVRFQEFSVLQPAKGPFFDILTFLGARRLILVNMCWSNVFQINLTWKFTSRGAENIFEPCSYLQYSRSYN